MIYLRQKLDSLFGKNNYEIEMDYLNYTLYIKSNASNSFIYKESIATINKINLQILYLSMFHLFQLQLKLAKKFINKNGGGIIF